MSWDIMLPEEATLGLPELHEIIHGFARGLGLATRARCRCVCKKWCSRDSDISWQRNHPDIAKLSDQALENYWLLIAALECLEYDGKLTVPAPAFLEIRNRSSGNGDTWSTPIVRFKWLIKGTRRYEEMWYWPAARRLPRRIQLFVGVPVDRTVATFAFNASFSSGTAQNIEHVARYMSWYPGKILWITESAFLRDHEVYQKIEACLQSHPVKLIILDHLDASRHAWFHQRDMCIVLDISNLPPDEYPPYFPGSQLLGSGTARDHADLILDTPNQELVLTTNNIRPT